MDGAEMLRVSISPVNAPNIPKIKDGNTIVLISLRVKSTRVLVWKNGDLMSGPIEQTHVNIDFEMCVSLYTRLGLAQTRPPKPNPRPKWVPCITQISKKS